MKIEEWFDTNNLEHMRAFKHLNKTGTWPIDFLPDDIEIDSLSSMRIFQILGLEFLDFKIEALEQE